MTIAQLLGHRVPAMTGRYAHLTHKQRWEAIEKLPQVDDDAKVDKKVDNETDPERGGEVANGK